MTLGVGGVQGTTVLAASGRLGAGSCLEAMALLPGAVLTTPPLGRSEESRRSDRDSAAAFSKLRGLVVVRRVRDNSQQAGRVRGSGISTV